MDLFKAEIKEVNGSISSKKVITHRYGKGGQRIKEKEHLRLKDTRIKDSSRGR